MKRVGSDKMLKQIAELIVEILRVILDNRKR